MFRTVGLRAVTLATATACALTILTGGWWGRAPSAAPPSVAASPTASSPPNSAADPEVGQAAPPAAAAVAEPPAAATPGVKLVVIVSVDQLAAEYLTRFGKWFRPGGFRRLMEQGAYFTECRHRHANTSTGPGHAAISTGCWPCRHGIINNAWFDPATGESMYCCEDIESPTLPAVAGRRDRSKLLVGRSPRNLLVNTIGDQMKIASGGKSRIVSVALKDRSAILMAGHAADEVYWYDSKTGAFVTSFYYRSDLAPWVRAFNSLPFAERAGLRPLPPSAEPEADDADDAPKKKGRPAMLPGSDSKPIKSDSDSKPIKDAKDSKSAKEKAPRYGWVPMHPVKEYEFLPLNNPKLSVPEGFSTKFPHPLPSKEADLFGAVYTTPFGNELVLNLAMAAVDDERLGKGAFADLLCVGFSANDVVGHAFGPYSREVMDMTIRTDEQIERLLNFLDARVGKGAYVLALTADHGVTPIHDEAFKLGVATFRTESEKTRKSAEAAMVAAFGLADRSYIREGSGTHLDRELLAARRIDPAHAERVLADALRKGEGVMTVFTRSELNTAPVGSDAGDELLTLAARNFHPARSSDVMVMHAPFTSSGKSARERDRPTGASHGAPYEEDMRVPMLIYGGGVPAGKHKRRVSVVDLAPTLAELLGVPRPSACQGRPLDEVFGR